MDKPRLRDYADGMISIAHLPDRTRGILFMLVSVTAFSLMDAIAKMLGQRVDVSQILLARYGGQLVVVLVLFGPSLARIARTAHPVLQLVRAIFQLCAAGCFFIGLKSLGLAEATAVGDLSPLFITLLAALFLGEKVGPRRLISIGVALCGALLIIKPGTDVFTPAAFWPLAAALCLAGYAVVTRHIGTRESPLTALLYSGLFGTAMMSLTAPARWVAPDDTALILMAVIGVIGTLGQLMMIRAYMAAEASVVAPFSYAGLITATLWGVIFFGMWPDLLTVVGAVVIVSAGLYVWHRETRDARLAVTVLEGEAR